MIIVVSWSPLPSPHLISPPPKIYNSTSSTTSTTLVSLQKHLSHILFVSPPEISPSLPGISSFASIGSAHHLLLYHHRHHHLPGIYGLPLISPFLLLLFTYLLPISSSFLLLSFSLSSSDGTAPRRKHRHEQERMKGGNKARAVNCELCNREATLYCDSDAAFLCTNCDADVHNANFLVARHVRRLICPRCHSLTPTTISGYLSPPSLRRLTCPSCSQPQQQQEKEEEEEDSISCSSSSSTLSSSSACISSTVSQNLAPKTTPCSRRRRVQAWWGGKWNAAGEKVRKQGAAPARGVVEARTEGVFSSWCRMLGINGDLVIPAATRTMGLCTGRSMVSGRALPLRVSLAASFWFALRVLGDKSLATWQNLRRLQELSGVPARLIVAVVGKMEQAVRLRRSRPDLEEGWAECSD